MCGFVSETLDFAVGRHGEKSGAGNLIREIDAETAAIDARAAELSLYRLWATHRLVPDAHIGLLMNVSRDGGVQ